MGIDAFNQRLPNDWYDRFVTVRDTFSSRVGQICNAAFDRSIIAYDENSDAEERERCRQQTEVLSILTGLEIDSAKSGVKPDLSEYLLKKRRVVIVLTSLSQQDTLPQIF